MKTKKIIPTKILFQLFIFISTTFSTKIVLSQEDLVWQIGPCTRMDFTSGTMTLTSTPDSLNGYFGTNTSICNKDSQLVFMTDGTTIYRSDGSVMPNGDTLVPGHYTNFAYPISVEFVQGAIVINQPGSDSIYYLLHEEINNDTLTPIVNNIYCTTIDISADSARGIIISKSQPFFLSTDTLMYGKLQTVRHANGRDWWFISKKGNSNDILEWLFTSDSIYGPTVIHYAGPVGQNSFWGQAHFSEDGNYYSIINLDQSISLFYFDRCTGNFDLIFSNIFNDNPGTGGGVAFSNNNQFLYATTGYRCYQFNLLDTNIWNTKKVIAIYDNLVVNGVHLDFERMYLAPDHKIYISPLSSNFIWSVINNPDLPDTLADLQQHSIQLFCYNNVACPNLPNFKLGSIAMSPCDTINSISENKINSFKLFPNPGSDYLNIELHELSSVYKNLKIYDIAGRVIISKPLTPYESEIKINISNFHKGIYLIELLTGCSAARQTFVKM